MSRRSDLHPRSVSRAGRTLTVLFAVVALLLGSTLAVRAAGNPTVPLSTVAATAPGAPLVSGTRGAADPPVAAASTTTVRVYLLMRSHGSAPLLVPVLRTIPATQGVAAAAIRQLLKGPASTEQGLVTSIPSGVKLLGISLSATTATVDLTGNFGSGTSTTSIRRRLAELTYTVTQFSTVKSVLLRFDGTPVSTIRGISIGAGMRRADFRGQLPEIFVDRPAWRGALPSGSRVSGLANVWEAQFNLRLLDRTGKILINRSVLATCGSGCWGTFGVTLRYHVATAQWGTLRVFDRSEKDGSMIDVRDYPVWLTP